MLSMDQCEDREEGVPPSKSTLCGEHESQTKAQRNQPGPPPSSVSCKSDWSKERGQRSQSAGSSCPSVRSDWSMPHPPNFSGEPGPTRVDQQRAEVSTGQSAQQHQTHLDSVVMVCSTTFTFVLFSHLYAALCGPEDCQCVQHKSEFGLHDFSQIGVTVAQEGSRSATSQKVCESNPGWQMYWVTY
ncbi:uncharacterized protein LOC112432736 isoform X2 [Maylandia zebra]|uniref:uncharacterized protein LOC112432736 isoform X2 n=1 Tax=Maylandia zebra TaxID=106582 RepID=UPI00403D316B